MVKGKIPDHYITIWDFLQGEMQRITIDRMVYSSEEEDFVDHKKMRQKIGSDKETMARELESKKNQEKFYLNAEIKSYEGNWFRNDGFSILRHQLPELISALQSICDGKHDDKMSFKISKLINPEENTEPTAEQEIDSEEKTEDIVNEEIISNYTKKTFDEWFRVQHEKKQEEILGYERCGFSKEKIYNMMNSKEYRDCFK